MCAYKHNLHYEETMTPKQFIAIRKALGLTHVKLGKVLRRSIRSISMYETGHTVIPYHVAESMKALGAKKGH